MIAPLVLAIDQGTSSTKGILVDATGAVIARAAVSVGVHHPRPGWVEQSTDEIWASVQRVVVECVAGVDASHVTTVGLANQRESVVLWDRASGRPIAPVLGWQDQRATALCAALRTDALDPLVRARSGLPVDAMFSASKARWLLDAHDPDGSRVARGELCLGTIDSWLIFQLTGHHLTEAGNASRTQLFDVHRGEWSNELLDLFGVPASVLPRVVASTGDAAAGFGLIQGLPALPGGARLAAVLADSHAALFAHGVRTPGRVKATYGTGSSVMGLVPAPDAVGDDLCLSVAWDMGGPDGLTHAVEGNIRASGALLVWLADLLGTTTAALLDMATGAGSDGVDIVPAFGGLGAPWWDDSAVGIISGLGFGSGPAQLARAGVEAVALQVHDVIAAIAKTAGEVTELLVDGGASTSATVMQAQADISQIPILRPQAVDLSAWGAAHLAGVVSGVWGDIAGSTTVAPCDEFRPVAGAPVAAARLARWHAAIDRARGLSVRAGI